MVFSLLCISNSVGGRLVPQFKAVIVGSVNHLVRVATQMTAFLKVLMIRQ
ncbi:hypothetical protein Brsp02_01292 [Brucella sp. NBRC 113783]